MSNPDLIVCGCGPAGLMAAIHAARAGARVCVLERLSAPAKKLLATGGGRCNLTNVLSPEELMPRFGRQGRFMAPALKRLDNETLRAFFRELGVETTVTDGFHVFPVSQSAKNVTDALLAEAAKQGVEIVCNARVTGIELDPQTRQVCGVRVERRSEADTEGGELLPCHAVILAAGGCSYKALGADGSGFALAEALGHRVEHPLPALVPLVTTAKWPHSLAGVVVEDAEVTVPQKRGAAAKARGALLFTHRGVSGPAILDISGQVAAVLALEMTGKVSPPPVEIEINFLPAIPAPELRERLAQWRGEAGGKQIGNCAAQLLPELPKSLAEALCRVAGLDPDTRVSEISNAGLDALAKAFGAARLSIAKTEGFAQAMVTKGGVSLKEVDPKTLQSRLAPGLYFAGEVLDLDGPCGGYNLQWAFASGALAGESAARSATGGI